MAHFGSISPLGTLSCDGQQPKTALGAGPSGEKLPLHGAWDTAGAYPKSFEQPWGTLFTDPPMWEPLVCFVFLGWQSFKRERCVLINFAMVSCL